jgi:hypothetical protein
MKLLSKIQLIVLALEVFKQYPDQDKCYAREDGNIFFVENHSELGRGKLKVYALDKADITPTKSNDATPAKPVEAKVETAEKKADSTIGKDGNNPETRTTKETE